MKRWKLVTCAVASLTALPLAVAVPAGAAPTGRYRAEIRRTAYGIPHVKAADYAGLGFGEGYAFARDNVCVEASRLVTLAGERSRYFGPDAANDDPLTGTSNLDSDVYEQAELRSGVVRRLIAQPAPLGPTREVRDVVRGYVAGYNRFLRDTGVSRLPDPTCRGAAWVRPMTELDVYRDLYHVVQLEGAEQAIAPIVNATPPTAGAPARAKPPVLPKADAGSNAYGLGRDATRGTGGMVLANPHFPWNGIGRFYQVQLTIPGRLNVTGAALYGTPLVEIGHTEHLAWSHTVSTAARAVFYRLTLAPGDPTAYLVDGHREAMTRRTVTVQVRGADGRLSSVSRTLYDSRYGPVLADGWTTTYAYAIRDVNARNVRAMNTWLAMDQADSVAQLRTAQDTYQGIPFTNTIAADSTGQAYYADASVAPHVTDEQLKSCAVDGPEPTLDGSASRCAWGNDPDAIEPGIFGPSRAPRLSRTDYVTNANNSPWLTNPDAPLTGFPQIFGDTGTPRSLRTRLGLDMVKQRLAGTDGLGPRGFDLTTLRRTMLGDRDLSAELLRDQLVAYCREHPTLTATDGSPVDVRDACRVLAAWDSRTDPGSRGAVLWREFLNGASSPALFRTPFDPAHPVTTPRDLNTADPAVGRALADAVQRMASLRVPLDEPLGAAQRYAGIAIPGCPGGEGCFNAIYPASPDLQANGTYPDVTSGSSFIMAVSLTPAGPRASTILTYSESANPNSPHHTDQTRLFSAKQWVPDRFTDADITADPAYRTTRVTG
ncbi:acylase [Actinoallomurus rhizosphaericola]|uniref:acylase n=1 Tax=Actinoallomurus rhizosphaericola TaxID=2952536 RepID=UPI0020922F9D|nr:acylase [Actinoallomurus rhizosphaericola]MCO5996234.1 acylase [Actinoallomurus rhizosphaericola]